MNDLNEKILRWADDKGILKNGTPEGQLSKTLEELVETAQAVALYDLIAESYHFDYEDANERLEHIKDGIGDVYVTVCIYAKLSNLEFVCAYFGEGTFTNKIIFEKIGESVLRIAADWCAEHHCGECIYWLNKLAQNHRLTLRECVEHSYNVIAKRSGKMIDGVFVKD